MSTLTDYLTSIADAIRAKKGTTGLIPAADFPAEIASIEGGGGGEPPVLNTLIVTANGVYDPEEGVDGFNRVSVNVPTEREPVLTDLVVTANGVYSPPAGADGFQTVTVNVPAQSHNELEYLIPNGAQYINTGINPSSETKVEIKVRRDAFSDQALFGSRRSSSSSDRFLTFMSTSTNAHCQFYNQSYGITVEDMTGVEVVATLSKDGYYYDDVLLQELPQTSFTSSYPMYLFALNQANSVNRPISDTRFYYCKIWQSDELVRDYIPVLLAGQVVCLYDNVTQKYYFNNGSGEFTAGPVKS